MNASIYGRICAFRCLVAIKMTYAYLYLQAVEGVQKIRPGYNPAAWMLDVTTSTEESRLGVDFAEIYRKSNLFQYECFSMNFSWDAFICLFI